jgi:hypothetical protein
VSTHAHSLEARYGGPSRLGRAVLVALAVLAVGGLAGWLAWATVVNSDPPVDSELIAFEIVDDHTATAVLRVELRDDEVTADCTVRAIAHDKSVVGEVRFTAEPADGPDHEIEIATVRRATAVDAPGCTTEDQPRPR